MKAQLLVGLLFFATIFTGYSQEKYPLSRQDSANILKYDSLSRIHLDQGNLKEGSRFLNKKAMTYWEHNHFQEALKHYEQSLAINEKLANENGIAMINSNMAMIYADMGKYKQSLEFFKKTLMVRKIREEKVGTISALINMSVVLNNMERYDQSVKRLKEALDLARELNDPKQMRSCYGMLAETYEKAGNTKKSMYYFDYYRTFHEKIQRDKIRKKSRELENERLRRELAEARRREKEQEVNEKQQELKFKNAALDSFYHETQKLQDSLTKQELSMKVLQQRKHIQDMKVKHTEELLSERKKANRNRMLAAGIIIGFTVILALLLYKAYRRKRKNHLKLTAQYMQIQEQEVKITKQHEDLKSAYKKISKQNKQITASINYARVIQEAMLHRSKGLPPFLDDAFIYYKPRDLVSGDFYWYAKTNGKFILAAVDCTGHGVPGAFMSMIGNNLLNQIVLTEHETDPANILTRMDEGVNETLNQVNTGNEDGMDAAICVIDRQQKQVAFAGAKRPLLYCQDDLLKRLKGDRQPIGGLKTRRGNQKKEFTTQMIPIRDKICLYLYSDGITDQFGGPNYKKLMFKGFTEILHEVQHLPMNQQKKFISERLEAWKNGYPQIDDILVLGVFIKA